MKGKPVDDQRRVRRLVVASTASKGPVNRRISNNIKFMIEKGQIDKERRGGQGEGRQVGKVWGTEKSFSRQEPKKRSIWDGQCLKTKYDANIILTEGKGRGNRTLGGQRGGDKDTKSKAVAWE